ncbi:MAG: SdpI family protein [Propionibacteriaceae bacterium]|nr:SdpI family protein [Propionibacteriaceae bacterium]
MGQQGPFLLGVIAFAGIMLVWLAFAVICWTGSTGRLPMTHWAGIRFPSTMKSKTTWVAAHRAARRHVLMSGIAVLPVATTLLFFLSDDDLMIPIMELALVLVMLVWVIVAGAVGAEAAREADAA